ncbi:MAG: TIGR03032 family protein [Pseudomonadota bacterium]
MKSGDQPPRSLIGASDVGEKAGGNGESEALISGFETTGTLPNASAGPVAPAAKQEPAADNVDYSVSGGLANRLAQMKVSLAFTSYQSGLLYFIGRNAQGGINIHQAGMPKPMGLCLDKSGSLTMTGDYQVMRFENVLEPDQRVNNQFDACYVPRLVHLTGRLDAHDVGVDDQDRPIFVNTRYNCLATVSPRHSFEPIWRPPFISALVDEDRCHLNGLAMDGGKPRYATAVSRSDTIDGWRDRRADGGIVIDIESGAIVCTGLSMPHSPRMYNDQLWLLNSGTGELGVVEGAETGKGTFIPKVFCPGFLRGLSFRDGLAFVGLSKPRYKRFEGLALDKRLQDADSEPWCGVQIIDLAKGSCVDWLRIDGKIAELYDLEVVPGHACPMGVGPTSPEVASLITLAGER